MRVKTFAITFALSFLLNCAAECETRTIWRVGTFDGSSAEFAEEEPSKAVHFAVDHDQARTDWYAFAPVASTGKPADPAAAPREIDFPIAGRPEHTYRLKISLMIERSSVPALRLGVNGRTGTFFLHPALDYNMGDMVAAFYPAYSRAEVVFDFPGSWLSPGKNTISLQAVSISNKGVPDAGFNYDAIELQQVDALPLSISAQVEPTIFYHKHEASVNERVDVYVRYEKHPRAGRVQLVIAGRTFTEKLRGGQDFGEERVSFDIPEFAPATRALLTVDVDNRTMSLDQVLQPRKKWTLFLVPHVHLDVGYTDYQAKVSAIQSRILDEAIDLAAQHPAFRFSTDGEWNLDQFLQWRTPNEKERILQALARQVIYIPAQSSNVLTGYR
jgi:hypothetical protein